MTGWPPLPNDPPDLYGPFLIAIALTTIVSVGFFAYPQIDIMVSRFFYRPETGGWPFVFATNPYFQDFRQIGLWVPRFLAFFLVVTVLLHIVRPNLKLPLSGKGAVYMMASGSLSTVILVNSLLKDFWGRARPYQTILFGGESPFTAAWVISDACTENCSFVSGEASAAFWVATIVFVLRTRWRFPLAVFLLTFATAVSLNRIAFGGHFISDVVIAAALTITIALGLHVLFYGRFAPPVLSERHFAHFFRDLGNFLLRRS